MEELSSVPLARFVRAPGVYVQAVAAARIVTLTHRGRTIGVLRQPGRLPANAPCSVVRMSALQGTLRGIRHGLSTGRCWRLVSHDATVALICPTTVEVLAPPDLERVRELRAACESRELTSAELLELVDAVLVLLEQVQAVPQ